MGFVLNLGVLSLHLEKFPFNVFLNFLGLIY